MSFDEARDDSYGSQSGPDSGRPSAGERIGLGGGDDAVVRFQLAARWAESFAPPGGGTLPDALRRFRAAYDYLDAVMHGIEPVSLEDEVETDSRQSLAGTASSGFRAQSEPAATGREWSPASPATVESPALAPDPEA